MFEIRNYHYEPTKFDKYQTWATKEAVPYLREHLDLVGFWMDNGEATEVMTPMAICKWKQSLRKKPKLTIYERSFETALACQSMPSVLQVLDPQARKYSHLLHRRKPC